MRQIVYVIIEYDCDIYDDGYGFSESDSDSDSDRESQGRPNIVS